MDRVKKEFDRTRYSYNVSSSLGNNGGYNLRFKDLNLRFEKIMKASNDFSAD